MGLLLVACGDDPGAAATHAGGDAAPVDASLALDASRSLAMAGRQVRQPPSRRQPVDGPYSDHRPDHRSGVP